MDQRLAYHWLVNADEYPAVLPIAEQLIRDRLADIGRRLPERDRTARDLDQVARAIGDVKTPMKKSAPWRHDDAGVARHRVIHYLTQYLPTALVDGSWLQGMLRVPMVDTELGACLSEAYAHQVDALVDDPEQRAVHDYRRCYQSLRGGVADVSTQTFSARPDLLAASFELPGLLLSLGQFPRIFATEIAGLHLAWQFLNLDAFRECLVQDACLFYSLPNGEAFRGTTRETQHRRQLALNAARLAVGADAAAIDVQWNRLHHGIDLLVNAWTAWFDSTQNSTPDGPPSPRQEMVELLCRKAAHAIGYHGQRMLAGRLLDDYFKPDTFQPGALLDHLAASRFVTPGSPEESDLAGRLVSFGGPMFGVFSPAELVTIRNWILSLDVRSEPAGERQASRRDLLPAPKEPRRSAAPAAGLYKDKGRPTRDSIRVLYHQLVNRESFPEALPRAEEFARRRFEQSRLTLRQGERPIPSDRYDPDLLEQWVEAKHRSQVESYRPLVGAPTVTKRELIESSVQLAPLILIDGAWLQGIAHPSLIQTAVGHMLFHVLFEESGEGEASRHHANIYRALLKAMGESTPDAHAEAFSSWTRFEDTSFEVPVLWLSVSCFPRHFLPEILGLNLAVELAGVGGPYLEARDALRYFGFPTLFVDLHNSADNISEGHSAWAVKAIRQFLDEIAVREGPHSVNPYWHRVWSGMRATLPSRGSIGQTLTSTLLRVVGDQAQQVTKIFPT